ncbi:hypothetical protein AHF37_09312 [Paragonimus kellicotti]|nr:hypothetical protein AHF37_09312 [Paragonimus kellicotti]
MYANSLRSWLRAMCLDPQWCAPRTCALRLVQFILELVHSVDQVRRELNGACTDVAGDAYHGTHEEHKLPMSHTKRLRDLIAPLAPCLRLLTLVNDQGQNEQLELSAAVKPKTEISKFTGQQRSAVTRLLGPYWSPAAGDSAATSLLSGTQKHKGKRSKSMRSLPPSCPLTTRPLQLSLFDDLKVRTHIRNCSITFLSRRISLCKLGSRENYIGYSKLFFSLGWLIPFKNYLLPVDRIPRWIALRFLNIPCQCCIASQPTDYPERPPVKDSKPIRNPRGAD